MREASAQQPRHHASHSSSQTVPHYLQPPVPVPCALCKCFSISTSQAKHNTQNRNVLVVPGKQGSGWMSYQLACCEKPRTSEGEADACLQTHLGRFVSRCMNAYPLATTRVTRNTHRLDHCTKVKILLKSQTAAGYTAGRGLIPVYDMG